MEMKHAERLIDHIIFLDGAPNMLGPTQITCWGDGEGTAGNRPPGLNLTR